MLSARLKHVRLPQVLRHFRAARNILEVNHAPIISNIKTPSRSFASICEASRYILSQKHICEVESSHSFLITKRFKIKKRQTPRSSRDNEDDEEDDENDDELSNENPLLMEDILDANEDAGEFMILDINSLRLDVVVKSTFKISRLKMEEAFYKGDILINGEKPSKKSMEVAKGDEIDVIKGIDPEDNKMININRVVILEFPDKFNEQGRIKIKVRRWMNLAVEKPSDGLDKET